MNMHFYLLFHIIVGGSVHVLIGPIEEAFVVKGIASCGASDIEFTLGI